MRFKRVEKRTMDDLNRLANTEFLRIVVGEIEPALVAHKVPLNHDTKVAFLVGVMVSRENMERIMQYAGGKRLFTAGEAQLDLSRWLCED